MVAASVIVPARNAAATLGATLAALAAQDTTGRIRGDRRRRRLHRRDRGRGRKRASGRPAGARARRRAGPGAQRRGGARRGARRLRSRTPTAFRPRAGWPPASRRSPAPTSSRAPCTPIREAESGPFDRTVWVVGEAGLYECASLFCTRSLFDRLGGFEDWLGARLGKPLAEDAWFGWRARRSGARTRFSDAALVHHAVFHREAPEFVAERARLVYFPAIARRMPELRSTAFFGRAFLSRRSAAFDAALAGAGASLGLRSRLPLVAAAALGLDGRGRGAALGAPGAAGRRGRRGRGPGGGGRARDRQRPRPLAADLSVSRAGGGARYHRRPALRRTASTAHCDLGGACGVDGKRGVRRTGAGELGRGGLVPPPGRRRPERSGALLDRRSGSPLRDRSTQR